MTAARDVLHELAMRASCTIWHSSLLFVLLAACSAAHQRDDCPPVAGACMDACCGRSTPPTFDLECRPQCPAGTSLVDRCAPGPSCPRSDAGRCDIDGGPIAPCFGGPCCDERADYDFCTGGCPPGFSHTCVPAPECQPTWLACAEPSDCQLAPATCCLPCDTVTLDDVDAVNASGRDAHRDAVCPDGAACPPCAPPEAPSLVATCQARQCTALDLRQHPISACTRDDECRIRVPDCCDCGADVREERLIAIRADAIGELTSIVCDSDQGCPECSPVYPDTVEAYCAPDGHCAVRRVP